MEKRSEWKRPPLLLGASPPSTDKPEPCTHYYCTVRGMYRRWQGGGGEGRGSEPFIISPLSESANGRRRRRGRCFCLAWTSPPPPPSFRTTAARSAPPAASSFFPSRNARRRLLLLLLNSSSSSLFPRPHHHQPSGEREREREVKTAKGETKKEGAELQIV